MRPVKYIDELGKEKRGTFHKWIERDGSSFALVEEKNGSIIEVAFTFIQFLDSK